MQGKEKELRSTYRCWGPKVVPRLLLIAVQKEERTQAREEKRIAHVAPYSPAVHCIEAKYTESCFHKRMSAFVHRMHNTPTVGLYYSAYERC